MARTSPFEEWIGFQRGPRGEGRAQESLRIEERHVGKRGIAHGGVVAALLDACCGAAVWSTVAEGEWAATASLHVEFLEGPKVGETVRATAEVTRRGRRMAFARGEAVAEDGRLVATAAGVWRIGTERPG